MQFIAQKWIEGEGSAFGSFNPATNEKIWNGREASSEQIEHALYAAEKALPDWLDLDFAQRVQIVKNFKSLLEQNQKFLAECISQEVGKPLWESQSEVTSMIGKCDLSIRAFHDRCDPFESNVRGARSITRYKPHGIVAVFGPFNFPGHLANGHIIPALLAGNVILFKPSELAPKVAEQTVKLWEKSGLPSGVLQLLQGGRNVGETLAAHPKLNGLFFTGSSRTGLLLSEAFGKHPEKILALEMGGNNPLIVHETRDIPASVYATLQSAYITSGQRCTCARRLIVTKNALGNEFVKTLQNSIPKIRIGSYTESPEPFMGPVIHEASVKNILQTQSDLQKNGGKILVAAQSLKANTGFISPGLIDVTDVKQLEDKECFGPLLQVIRVDDFDAALHEANNTTYGLAAGLLCDDENLYKKFWKTVRAGVLNFNQPLTGAVGSAPFGGVGLSGNHRASGYFAADYCAYPVASLENTVLKKPESNLPGLEL